jgi:hypothetical protein
MCIFSSQPAWMSFQSSQMSFVQMMAWRGQLAGQGWLEYPFHKSHPIIRWLPTKLAAWIGENFGQELQIPPQAGRGVDCRGVECHPGEQPGSQPRGQRAASDIRLHSVGV